MDVAKIDSNGRNSLTAVSSLDDTTIVRLIADPITKRLLVEWPLTSGSGAPLSTPSRIGQLYIDTSGAKVYISTGTTSSADWSILN